MTGALTLRNGDTEPAAFVAAAARRSGRRRPSNHFCGQRRRPRRRRSRPGGANGPPAAGRPRRRRQPSRRPCRSVEPTPAPPVTQDVAPSSGDTDGDGLSDADEIAVGSDPLNRTMTPMDCSTASRGLPSSAPIRSTMTPTAMVCWMGTKSINMAPIPTTPDSDGDGLGDADELFVYGTCPAYDTDGDGRRTATKSSTTGRIPRPHSGP